MIMPLFGIGGMMALLFTFQLQKFYLTLFMAVVAGGTIIPSIPAALELGGDLTFPVHTSLSSGTLYMSG